MERQVGTSLTMRQLADDIRVVLRMAGFYSILAIVVLGGLGLMIATGRPRSGAPIVPVWHVLATIGLFVLAYFTAALSSGLAVFLLRPLRSSWIGWAVTGGVVAGICYGSLFTFFTQFGSVSNWFWRLRGGSPPEPGDLVGMLVLVGAFAVPIGAVFGVYWRDNPD